ncbi:MAG: TVP38/TMEM64 family protein [Chitinophagales bacterium]|nr:TVP38/TMEM64 family protein [Hyphomicrobiales bacterium]
MKWNAWSGLRLTVAVFALTGVVLIATLGSSALTSVDIGVSSFVAFCNANWWAFALVYLLVICTGFFPASAVVMAAGAVYGFGWGVALTSVCTLIGAGLSFAVCRSFLRPMIGRVLSRNERFRGIDSRIASDGLKFVFLLRISPLMPFSVANFLLGLSSIRFRDYFIGTLGSMPALVAYVFAGSLSRDGFNAYQSESDIFKSAVLIVGAISTILLFAYAHHLLMRCARAPRNDLENLRPPALQN